MEPIYQNISIEQIADGAYKARSVLDKNHIILASHFPGHPILPGVVILSLFRILTSVAVGKNLRLQNAGNVKFIKPLIPGDDLMIEAEFFLKNHKRGYEVEGKIFYSNELIAKSEALIFTEEMI